MEAPLEKRPRTEQPSGSASGAAALVPREPSPETPAPRPLAQQTAGSLPKRRRVDPPLQQPLPADGPAASQAESAGQEEDGAASNGPDIWDQGAEDEDELAAAGQGEVPAELWFKELSTLVFAGRSVVERVRGKDVIIMLGHTGAGKTTLLHFLAGSRLLPQGGFPGGGATAFVPQLDAGGRAVGLEDFLVGHELVSQTRALMPFFRPGSAFVYVDCAGSMDTRGDEVDIATAVSLRNLTAVACSVRFLVVISCADFHASRGSSVRNTARRLAHLVLDDRGRPDFKHARHAFTFIFSHLRHLTASVERRAEPEMRMQLCELLRKAIKGTPSAEAGSTLVVLWWIKQCLLGRRGAELFHPEWPNRDLLLEQVESTDPKDRLVADPECPLQKRISCRVSPANEREITLRLQSFSRSVDRALEREDFSEVQDFLLTMERLQEHIPLADIQAVHAELRNRVSQKQAQLTETAKLLIELGTRGEQAFSPAQAEQVTKCMSDLDALQASRSRDALAQALSAGLAALEDGVAAQLCFKSPADPPLPNVAEVRRCLGRLGIWAELRSAGDGWGRHAAAADGFLQRYVEQLLHAARDGSLRFPSMVAVYTRLQHILPHAAELLGYDAAATALHAGAEQLLLRRISGSISSKGAEALGLLESAAIEDCTIDQEARKRCMDGFRGHMQDLRGVLCLFAALQYEVPCLVRQVKEALGALHESLDQILQERDSEAASSIALGEYGARLHGLLLAAEALAGGQGDAQSSSADCLRYRQRVKEVEARLRDISSRLEEHIQMRPQDSDSLDEILTRCQLLWGAAWFDEMCLDGGFVKASLEAVSEGLHQQQDRACGEVQRQLHVVFSQAQAPSPAHLQGLRASWDRVRQLSAAQEFCQAALELEKALHAQILTIAGEWCAAKTAAIGREVHILEDVKEADATAIHHVLSVLPGLDFLPIQTEEVRALEESAKSRAEQWKALGRAVLHDGGFYDRTALLKTSSRWTTMGLTTLTDGMPKPAELQEAIARAWGQRIEQVEHALSASPDSAWAELQRLREDCLPPEAHEVWRRLREQTELLAEKVALRLENVPKEMEESLELLDFAAVTRHLDPHSAVDAGGRDRRQARVVQVKRRVRLRLSVAREAIASPDLARDLADFERVREQVGSLLKEGPDPLDLAEEVEQLKAAANDHLAGQVRAVREHIETSRYAEAMDLLEDAEKYYYSIEHIFPQRRGTDLEEKRRALEWRLGRLARRVADCVEGLAAAAKGSFKGDFVEYLVLELRHIEAARRRPELASLHERQVGKLKQALEDFHNNEMRRVEDECMFEAAIQKYTWLKNVMDAGLQKHVSGLSFDTRAVIEDLREKETAQNRQFQDDLVSEMVIVDRVVPLFKKLFGYWNTRGSRRCDCLDFVRLVKILNAHLHKHLRLSTEFLRGSTYEGCSTNLFSFIVLWKHLHKYAQAKVTVPVPPERMLEDFETLVQEMKQVLYLLINLLIESLRGGTGPCATGAVSGLESSFSRYSSFVRNIIMTVSYLRDEELRVFPCHVREAVRDLVQACPGQLARFHEALAGFTSRSLRDLSADLERFNYRRATRSVQVTRHLTQFLACPFAAYRDDLQDLRYAGDSHLVAVDTLSQQLGGKHLAELGKHYAVLQVSPGASPDEIAKAFRSLSRQEDSDKQAGMGCHRLQSEGVQRRLKAAQEALARTDATTDDPLGLGTLLGNAVSRSVTELQSRICEHLGQCAYDRVKHLLEAIGALDELSMVCKLPMSAASVVQQVHTAVHRHVEEIKAAVARLWQQDDLSQLQRQLDKLAIISSSFGGYPDIYSDDWRDAIKRDVQSKINNFAREAAARLRTGEDSMYQFAIQLLHLARIFDNLKDFKSQAVEQVNALLELCKGKPGGFAYLFRLGMLLEQGKIGDVDDGRVRLEDQRLGKVIVKEFSQFRDVVNVTWNAQTEFTHKDVESTLRGMRCDVCLAGGSPAGEGVSDCERLKKGWHAYKAKYDDLFYQWRAGHLKVEHIPEQAFSMVNPLPPCSSGRWPQPVRDALPELIAVIFAYFTISKSGDSYRRLADMGKESRLTNEEGEELAPEMLLVRPHSVQILTLLHLLAYDSADESLRSRLMQVRTGEGKSIILGGLSVLCAVLGFKVRCVCYSSYLSQRDYKMFEGLFRAFGVKERVVYSKITDFSEHRSCAKGDIRECTLSLLREESSSPGPARSRPRAAVADADSSGAVGLRPLRGDAEELLLIDEVDVFFGEDFYGQTYNVVATLPLDEAAEILEFLWRHRDARSRPYALLQRVRDDCPAYSRLLEKLPAWSYLVEGEVLDMCVALRDYDKEPCNEYHYNEELKRIGYKVMDSYDYDVEYGYRTCFAWLAVADDPGRGLRDEAALLKKALQLRVPCGHFSYASIGSPTILGVSGTITALGSSEWRVLEKYGITGFSAMPSVYGDSNLRIFDQTGNPPLTISAAADHARDLANQAKNAARAGRAVIMFFRDPAQLQATADYLKAELNVNVLLEVMDDRDKDYVIKKAATSGQITLATAIFGRGTDFFSSDPSLDAAGGVHVIQAFFSADQCQEVQIQGRTARQGKAGTFSWVLSEEEVTAWGPSVVELKTRVPALQYEELKRVREERCGSRFDELEKRLAEASEKDELTHQYFDALLAGSPAEARRLFKAMYDRRAVANRRGAFSTCRMVCLSDATGSMKGIWSSTKRHIKEMLRRVAELTGGRRDVLEIMWVAYRDYSDAAGLLEPSGWSDSPAALQQFINGISCTGGGDTEEAVEHALEFARNEHIREPISRILLIADAPPHFETKGQKLTGHDHWLRTDYLEEANALKGLGVPVFTFVVGEWGKTFSTFQEISHITGGRCERLSDPAQLLDVVCVNALEDIGGSALVAEYRAKYK